MTSPAPAHPHHHDLAPFRHSHHFGDDAAPTRERALWWVTWITLATMAVELGVGWWSGSLALVADGWHMGTHALALGGAALAAHYSRRVRNSARFTFGGWKIEVLAAYTSGLMLLGAGLWIGIDAIAALQATRRVAYAQAMVVAGIGLAVNLVCAAILARAGGHGHRHRQEQEHDGHGRDGHAHDQHDGHEAHARGVHDAHAHQAHEHEAHAHEAHARRAHAHGAQAHGAHGAHASAHDAANGQPRHHDHNFSAAYLHVLADAFTSVLAIAALAGGLWWGWAWLDPAVAIVGAAVIGRWAVGVLRDSARALVDASAPPKLAAQIRALIESDGDAKLADLHVWQVGSGAYAAALCVVADAPQPAHSYGKRLQAVPAIKHATIEVHRCAQAAPATSH
jgi:cation diffusion facilitator family transporter